MTSTTRGCWGKKKKTYYFIAGQETEAAAILFAVNTPVIVLLWRVLYEKGLLDHDQVYLRVRDVAAAIRPEMKD